MTEEERREREKAFTPEESITFNMLDEDTVALLQERNEVKLPKRKISVPKDERWNMKTLNSILLAGIEQGDSIPKIANAVFNGVIGGSVSGAKDIVTKNKRSAVRAARTMVTAAECEGRLNSYKKLDDQGVVQKKVWIATPDSRTRDSHFEIDGEEVDVDKEFSNGLMFPADPDGAPAEVWNCRCTMRTNIVGFRRADGTISKIEYNRDETMHDRQMKKEKERREAKKQKNIDQNIHKDKKIGRNYDCDLAKGYGKDYYDDICDLVDNCGSDDLKKVWGAYQSQIRVPDPKYKGRGYASAGNIHVDVEKDAKGSSWQAKYEVTFHESGHAIDHLSRDLIDTQGIRFKFSSAYKNGAFPATIREEVADMVKAKDIELKALFKEHKTDYAWLHEHGFISDYSWGFYERNGKFLGGEPKYSKSFAYKAIQKEIMQIPSIGRSDLSDLLEGATDGRIQCGYGHGKSYWKKLMGIDEKLATEAFAEMTSATIANGDSLATIKQYLPKSYKMYEDMLKEIASKGGK